MTTEYATKVKLMQFMGLLKTVPNNKTQTRDNTGTGDNTNATFWITQSGVIDGTLILSYGASESSLTALTVTTHYSVDYDASKITLTSAGITALSTDNLYAEYSYNMLELTDTQMSDALDRAAQEIDNFTNNHFTDGTSATPNWNQSLNEKQEGQMPTNNNYFTLQNYPIANVSTTLDGAVLADDTTITVVSTNGFPESGYFLVEEDKIQYTGKTTTDFTGCTSVSAHDTALTVKSYVVEVSTTDPQGEILWDILAEDTQFDMDLKTGRIHLYGSYIFADVATLPLPLVANRFRVSYISGTSEIPLDITKATLMIASRDIMGLAVRKAHSLGMNEFNPSLVSIDKTETDKILAHYRNEMYSGC